MTTQKITRKGDFMIIERANRAKLDSTYRHLNLTGCTLNQEGLIEMGKGIHQVRGGNWDEISKIEEAISVIESSGWLILKFMN